MDEETPHASTTGDDDTEQALRDARSRFVAGFAQRLGAMDQLLEGVAEPGADGALAALQQAAHKMAGLAGMLGFPSVSESSALLEDAVRRAPLDTPAARQAIHAMGAGFTRDLSGTPPAWTSESATARPGARILVVEDDQEQLRIVTAGLRAAGYRVITAGSGPDAVRTAQVERPDLILLDVDLPGLDGLAVCRQLKLNASLASVPVVFVTARSSLLDRTAGLTLGADDYICKPFAPTEVLIRIRRLLARTANAPREPTAAAPAADATGLIPYDMFALAARAVLAREPAALAILRVPSGQIAGLAERLVAELQRRDLVCRYSDSHLTLLMPGIPAAAARATVQRVIDTLDPAHIESVSVGVADTSAPLRDGGFEALLAQADLALAGARVSRGGAAAGSTTVLLAEDDPDVLRIVDARLKAGGYRTVVAFDGEQTLELIERESPAVLVLDLMMPKLTGFDVLARLRDRANGRPRTIVLSGRGRDEDITRAFELGADDYLTKPFNPEELMARVARLTR